MGSCHIPKHSDCFASNACTGYTVRSYLIVHWIQALGKRQVCQGMAEFPLTDVESGPEVQDSCGGSHAEGCMGRSEQGSTGSDSIRQHCCKSSLAEGGSDCRPISLAESTMLSEPCCQSRSMRMRAALGCSEQQRSLGWNCTGFQPPMSCSRGATGHIHMQTCCLNCMAYHVPRM